MQYNTLLTRIAADIYSNGAELITGDLLQNVLNDMVGALASAGACYKGTITPASAAPLDLDQPTVYLALTAGTYTNFVDSNNDPIVTTGPALIIYEGGPSLVFSKTDLPFATTGDLSNYLELDGGTMGGAIDMDGYAIQNVPDPVNNGDAANKAYVDSKQPWKVTIEPDADMSYILIKLGEPSHSCILAIDSASGAGALHGILCIDENFDITGAVFAGSGGLDTTVDAKSGYDDNSPRNFIAVLKFRNDQPVTLTCIGGNAPQSAEAIDALGGETFTSTRAWTDLEAGGGGGGNIVTSWQDPPLDTNVPSERLVFDSCFKKGVISQTQTWTQAADYSWSYVMSNPVYGTIPQMFIEMWKMRGGSTADFDDVTGYFKYLNLTDISYEEAKAIYAQSCPMVGNEVFTKGTSRAVLPFLHNNHFSGVSTYGMFSAITLLEACTLDDLHGHDWVNTSNPAYIFNSDSHLKYIGGVLNVNSVGSDVYMFSSTRSLETVKIKNLGFNILFSGSPHLSMESIEYMITNAKTATITITLHPTAYAAAQSDAGVQAALSSKTNVSLASA